MKNSSVDSVLDKIAEKPALVNYVVSAMTFGLAQARVDITDEKDRALVEKLINNLDTWEK
ncbi:hypothetical protein BGM19_26845 [Streptomyces agglomeratus]|uniref:hypothetical protein n=1 Tax=Streptomyces agglomeratus TaxID=285458 RepID=UPI00086D8C98|nr:hypothetical protein [Streptomyces agglomeratus]OEJ61094.1 hypothetical protein BGM19_26845 [Streptomyces agglomeratus]